jgi:hypothetical protein
MKSLKEIYGLREMSVEVPDENVAALRKVVKKAAQLGMLPPEADSWIPKKSKYVSKPAPADEPEAQPATPEKGKKAVKGKKAKEPEAPVREPIAVDPAVKADLDKSQSAWDRLGQKIDDPGVPLKSKVKSEPMKGPEFDPTGIHPDYDMPNLGAPKSANVKLNKKGQPERDPDDAGPDMFAGAKKPGMLSRLFGRKKAPTFDANPYEFEPEQPKTSKPVRPDLSKFIDWEDGPDSSPGKDALDDLGDFLRGNPRQDGRPTGDDAMRDLEWDLKRSKGKR